MIAAAVLALALAAPPDAVDPLAQLAQVNTAVNRSVRYRSDEQLYGRADVWAAGAAEGDCEDIAIAKRAALIGLGWPSADLRLVRVDIYGQQGHAVLEVRWAGHEPVLLDNMFGAPIDWSVARANGYGYGSTMKLRPARLLTVNGRTVEVVGP